MGNLEMFTLRVDHSVAASQFNLFQSSTEMRSHGVLDIKGKLLDPCRGRPTYVVITGAAAVVVVVVVALFVAVVLLLL